MPVRIEIGEREIDAGKAVVVARDTKEKMTVGIAEAPETVEKTGKAVFQRMAKAVRQKMEENIASAERMDALGKLLEGGKIVKVPFCSIEMEGKPCYEKIKEALKAEVRGRLFGDMEKPKGKKCIVCGKDAEEYAYVARQY